MQPFQVHKKEHVFSKLKCLEQGGTRNLDLLPHVFVP